MKASFVALSRLSLALLPLVPTTALGGYGFTASPAKLYIESKPGSVESREILLMNNSSTAVRVDTYAWDLWYGRDRKITYGPPGSFPNSAAPWITTVPKTQIVGPNERAAYSINFTTPQSAKGGHYAVVFAEVKPVDPTEKLQNDAKSAQFGLRLGTVIYQTTVGGSQETVAFEKTNVKPGTRSRPLEISTLVSNTGNTFLNPKVSVRLLDAKTKTVAKVTLEIPTDEPETVLPGQARTFKGKFTGELRPGSYTALITCEFGKQGLKTVQVPFVVKS